VIDKKSPDYKKAIEMKKDIDMMVEIFDRRIRNRPPLLRSSMLQSYRSGILDWIEKEEQVKANILRQLNGSKEGNL
jgi:hypothetical protein